MTTTSPTPIATAPTDHRFRFAQVLLKPSVLCPLVLLLLVVMLWAPFGLNVGFTTDDWHFFGEVDQGGYIPMPLRPFTSAPWRVAAAISPESFVGANLLLLGMLFLKVWLIFEILRALDLRVWLAFTASALTAIYPADTGVFWISTLNLNFAIVNLLVAIWALLRYWRYGRLTSALIMWMALALALGTYEPTFIFAAAMPALLLVRERRFSRRLVRVAALWYAVPLAFGLRYAYVALTQPAAGTYQQRLFDLSAPLSEYIQSVGIILRRHFLDGWLSPGEAQNPAYLLFALVSAIVVFSAILILFRQEGSDETGSARKQFRFALGLGIAVMILGLIPYLVTSMRTGTLRTYYYSSVGASLIVAALLGYALVEKLGRRTLFAGVIALLTVAGTYSLLLQHAWWAEWSQRQQVAMAALVRSIGAISPDTTLIVVDETADKTFQTPLDGSWFLSNILNILYRDYTLRGAFCEPDSDEPWGSMVEACQFNDEGLVFTLREEPMHVRPYGQLVLVRHLGDNTFAIEPDLSRLGLANEGYRPFDRLDLTAPPPDRLQTLFGME